MPLMARTREYLLNADLTRQLAHRDRARAGRMKSRYVGSKKSMVSWISFQRIKT
jgi:hypothetical protein